VKLLALVARYLLVGGSVGLLFLGAGYLLREAAWDFSTSVLLAFLLTTPLSFMGQRRLVFRSKGAIRGQAIRYMLVCTLVWGASAAIQQVYSGAGVLAQVVVWALASAANFIGYRFVVFTRGSQEVGHG
jgi:putative flippase GtrA